MLEKTQWVFAGTERRYRWENKVSAHWVSQRASDLVIWAESFGLDWCLASSFSLNTNIQWTVCDTSPGLPMPPQLLEIHMKSVHLLPSWKLRWALVNASESILYLENSSSIPLRFPSIHARLQLLLQIIVWDCSVSWMRLTWVIRLSSLHFFGFHRSSCSNVPWDSWRTRCSVSICGQSYGSYNGFWERWALRHPLAGNW